MSNTEFLVVTSPPVNLKPEDTYCFSHEYNRIVDEPGVLKVSNCFILPDGIIYRYLKLVRESVNPCFDHTKYTIRILIGKIRTNKINYLYNNKIRVGVAFDRWSDNYFHWITETIPRIHTLKESYENVELLLPDTLNKEYHLTVLNRLNINNITWIPSRSVYFVKNILLSRYTSDAGVYNPGLLLKVRKALINKTEEYTSNIYDKLYISRAKAKYRRIINENEVTDCLEDYGFTTLRMEEYDFKEQVSLMRNVKYLVSVHGAGLTNMLFMEIGGSILEFRRNGDNHNNCYFSLASVLSHKYFYQFCNTDTQYSNNSEYNLYVNIDVLKYNLDLMLK
jgi:capsular polysaccharide biosynthesis protein